MAALTPRPPYTEDELKRLFPEGLQLEQVQILLRHGERTPVSPRFQNAGLPAYWAYCNAAKRFRAAVATSADASTWGELAFKRRLETFGHDDEPVIAAGPRGELDAVCLPGELTDQGRQTTLALGQRLRHLYVKQLQFLPPKLLSPESLYLRSTPIPRAIESLEQAFEGLYPLSERAPGCPLPVIVTRAPQDETLFPNDSSCRRFGELTRAFAQRCADRWNDSKDMDYLNQKIGKWMPESSPRAKVDSHPRLSGIMDTINATRAHGPLTRLPKEFYDDKMEKIINKIAVEEWFAGYSESREYRKLGVGSLLGDITERIMAHVEDVEAKDAHDQLQKPKFALSGCHDTTLAAILTSLGAFDGEHWPPFSSSLAVELFRKSKPKVPYPAPSNRPALPEKPEVIRQSERPSWWSALFGSSSTTANVQSTDARPLSHTPRIPSQLQFQRQKDRMQDFYVRLRFNDRVMKIPACKPEGKHLDGDESFCTLEAFKNVVDAFTPSNWRQECLSNLGKGVLDADMRK